MPGRFHSVLYTLPAAALSSEEAAGLASSALKQRMPGLITGSLRPFSQPLVQILLQRDFSFRSCFWNHSSSHNANGNFCFCCSNDHCLYQIELFETLFDRAVFH